VSEENNDTGSDQPTPKKKKSSREEFPLQEYKLVPAEEWEEEYDGANEIDVIELVSHIWDSRSSIYRVVTLGIFLGLLVAFLSPVEYESNAILLPEVKSSEGGASQLLEQYGGLLGMSGSADLGSSAIIPPQLFPQIVSSLPFQLKLLNQRIEFQKVDTTTTVYEFFTELHRPSFITSLKKYTIGLPNIVVNLFRKETSIKTMLPRGFETDSILVLSKGQFGIINDMRKRVSINLDEEAGVIYLNVTMPDPYAAAQVANVSIDLIREYVTNYKTRKSEEDLKYAIKQMQTANEKFILAQNKLAEFRDSNINLSSARAETQLERLQSEYDLTFNVYNSLAQQVEQAKLKVQEQTPVLSVLQPAHIPIEKSQPKRTRILFIFIGLSLVIGISKALIFKFYLLNTE
jgi:uncharacterized protein involved in exopolysaccharide biosynthesis